MDNRANPLAYPFRGSLSLNRRWNVMAGWAEISMMPACWSCLAPLVFNRIKSERALRTMDV